MQTRTDRMALLPGEERDAASRYRGARAARSNYPSWMRSCRTRARIASAFKILLIVYDVTHVALLLPRPSRRAQSRDHHRRRAAGRRRARAEPVSPWRRRPAAGPRAAGLGGRRRARHRLRGRRRRGVAPALGARRAVRRGRRPGRSRVPRGADRAPHRRAPAQRARLPAVQRRAAHGRPARRRRHRALRLRPAGRRQRPAARARRRAERRDPPGPAGTLHVDRRASRPRRRPACSAVARWRRRRRPTA